MDYKLIIGIDISKRTLDATGIKTSSRNYPHNSFLNEKIGFKSFQKWMNEFAVEPDDILVCMEHTGFYMLSLCSYLQDIGIDFQW